MLAKASPVYTAAAAGITKVSAVVPRALLQPKIPPSRLENRKLSPLNPVLALKTMPVGVPAPGMLTSRAGLVITGGDWAPPVYKVAKPVPSFAIQAGLALLKAI